MTRASMAGSATRTARREDEMRQGSGRWTVVVAVLVLAGSGCVEGGPGPVHPVASADPCLDLMDLACDALGTGTEECAAMVTATSLLPPSACRAALAEEETLRAAIEEARGACRELAERLCADVGEGADACALVREQTPRFPVERCRSMLENYDAILAEVRCMEQAGRPVAAELWARAAASDAPSAGPPDAAVVLVLFSDFQCPYCAQAAAAWEEVRERFAGASVRFVFRQFPLSFHEFARPAAEASLYAASQGRFWEFHDRVFDRQRDLDLATLEDVAMEVGLSADGLTEALRGERWSAAVEADLELGVAMCVSGTPSLFVQGEAYQGDPRDAEGLSEAIVERLRAAGAAVPAPAADPETPAAE